MEKKKLIETISNFKKIKCLVVGDLILDKYIFGNTDRISPEAPVPVVNVLKETKIVGGAGNVAINLSNLSSSVTLLSQIGPDKDSFDLISLLNNHDKINTSYISYSQKPVSTKTRVVSKKQQIVRIDREDTTIIGENQEKYIIEKLRYLIRMHDIIICQDYGKGFLTPNILTNITELCNLEGKQVVVDPNIKTDYPDMKNTVATPNEIEYSQMKKESFDNFIVTLGERGMLVFVRGDISIKIPPIKEIDVVDTVGAGDTVTSIVSLGLASGLTLEESSYLANIAASIVIQHIGTYPIKYNELISAINLLN